MADFVDVVDVLLTLFFGERQHDCINKNKGLKYFVDIVDVVF
ncbi:TPA: hypothetical protein ACGOTD_002206 [Streptococcus suis]